MRHHSHLFMSPKDKSFVTQNVLSHFIFFSTVHCQSAPADEVLEYHYFSTYILRYFLSFIIVQRKTYLLEQFFLTKLIYLPRQCLVQEVRCGDSEREIPMQGETGDTVDHYIVVLSSVYYHRTWTLKMRKAHVRVL